ncbi:MAG: hypothetical protein IJA15_00735 [Clostridia bacterium]|nr:hypothetical protein [Clostridia bacterium]
MSNSSITASYDSLPLILRIIIQLIGGAVVGGIYRIIKFVENRNLATLVVGLLATFTGIGNLIAWVVDLITLIFSGAYTVFAD